METGSLDPRLIQAIVRSLYRLFRVGTFHFLDNDAVTIATEDTLRAMRSLEAFESEGITLVFAEETCIVNGQLLRAPPDIYESAMNFSRFLDQIDVNAISIGKAVGQEDLRSLLALFVAKAKSEHAGLVDDDGWISTHIRLRLINPNLLLGLEDDRLTQLERVLLTYALSVLVIRRLFHSIREGGFDLAGYFKRMARQLSTVNYAERPVVFDVIIARHLQPDIAKLSVNSAILAVAMTRRLTDHEMVLSRICMAALLLDVGRHRAATVDKDFDLPRNTAIIHMAMGDLRGDSIERTLITYEAQSLLGGSPARGIYDVGTLPSIDAYIIATSRRFTDLVTQGRHEEGRSLQLSTDGAIEQLHREATTELGHYCIDLLVDAIGLIPRGAIVELASGWRGVVLASGPNPTAYAHPTVRLVYDERGRRVEASSVVLHTGDADAERHAPVMRVLHRPDPYLRQVQNEVAGELITWIESRQRSEQEVRVWLDEEEAARDPLAAEDSSFFRSEDTDDATTVTAAGGGLTARQRALGLSTADATFHSRVAAATSRGRRKRSAASAEFARRNPAAAHHEVDATGAYAAIVTAEDIARVRESGSRAKARSLSGEFAVSGSSATVRTVPAAEREEGTAGSGASAPTESGATTGRHDAVQDRDDFEQARSSTSVRTLPTDSSDFDRARSSASVRTLPTDSGEAPAARSSASHRTLPADSADFERVRSSGAFDTAPDPDEFGGSRSSASARTLPSDSGPAAAYRSSGSVKTLPTDSGEFDGARSSANVRTLPTDSGEVAAARPATQPSPLANADDFERARSSQRSGTVAPQSDAFDGVRSSSNVRPMPAELDQPPSSTPREMVSKPDDGDGAVQPDSATEDGTPTTSGAESGANEKFGPGVVRRRRTGARTHPGAEPEFASEESREHSTIKEMIAAARADSGATPASEAAPSGGAGIIRRVGGRRNTQPAGFDAAPSESDVSPPVEEPPEERRRDLDPTPTVTPAVAPARPTPSTSSPPPTRRPQGGSIGRDFGPHEAETPVRSVRFPIGTSDVTSVPGGEDDEET